MLIHKLHLEKFCQHSSLDVHLMPGLNMLAGPNGSGKTNILRALQLALIGDAGGDRPKADDIFQGIAAGEESFVELDLSHYNTRMTVRRSLRPSTNLLTIGGENWRAVNAINDELCRRLGATRKQVADYIFVRQRKIDEMFDQRPADRAASLAALFGVEHAERVHKKMGEFIGAIEIETTTLDEDTLSGQLLEQEQVLVAADEQIAALDMPEDPAMCVHNQQQLINQHAAMVATDAKLVALSTDIVAKRRVAEAARLPLRQLLDDIAAKAAEIDAVAAVCTMAEEGLQQWKTHDASFEAREQWKKDRDAAMEKRQRLKEPVAPKSTALTAEQDEERKALAIEVDRLDHTLRNLRETDTCPTCGQDYPDASVMEARRIELRESYHDIGQKWETLDIVYKEWAKYRQQKGTYDEKHAVIEETLTRLRVGGETLAQLRPPEEAVETYQAILAERVAFQRELQVMTTQSTTEQVAVAKRDGELEQLERSIDVTAAELEAMPAITEERCQEATQLRDAVLANQRALVSLQRQRAIAAANVDATAALIDSARKTQQKGQRSRDAKKHLDKVRQVFHRNEAPHMVAYTYVEQMLDEVNAALEIFEAPFRVEMDESCGFIARFLDGIRVQADRRLSVGERIILAMAFRITVNSTFAGQVGVLIMDEPTAGLDEHNLGGLPRALDRLRELSHERGLQVLFVTHEPRISHHFDNIIELAAA